MSETFNCGFARAAAKFSTLKDGRVDFNMKSRWTRYHSFFDGQQEQHEVSLKCFRKKIKTLLATFESWRAKENTEKDHYPMYFSSERWKSLSTLQKQQHSVRDCRACMVHHHLVQSTFPLPKMRRPGSCQGPVAVTKKVAANLRRQPQPVRNTRKAMVETTKEIYNTINKPFKEIYGVEFSEAQTRVPDLYLQKQLSKSQKNKSRRDTRRADKQMINQMFADTEAEAVLSTRQSLSQRNKKRTIQFFENKDVAEERAKKRKELEECGERVPKRHSPDPESLTFDKDGLLEEVRQLKDGDPINYSALSRKYGLEDQSTVGGMVVKEFLLKENVDLTRFQRNHRTPERAARRRLNRLPGGEITVPVPPTNTDVTEAIKVKIQEGEYSIGELIVPRKYKTMVITKDGILKKGTFTVSGRKIPLLEIRQRELNRLEEAGVVRGYSDEHYANLTNAQVRRRLEDINEHCVAHADGEDGENMKAVLMKVERTRYMKQWADNSTVLNHGHFLMMVSSIYDEAFFYTSKELEEQGKPGINVQQIVERPHVYILGRCSSSEIEQMGYVSTRGECLKELETKVKLKSGVYITDVMRLFTGDGPEQDSEGGEQQGGYAGCVLCSGDSRKYRNLVYSYQLPSLSLKDRTDIVRSSPAGRSSNNGGLKPFVGLSLEELKGECIARQLEDEGNKKVLETRLKNSLRGIQRVPALLLMPHGTTLKDLHLESYEIVPTEPLHDVKEHIKNLTTELAQHLTKEEKTTFSEVKDVLFGSKDKLRGSDYRLAIVIISQYMRGKCRLTIQHILDTMVEISRIAYAPAEKRSPKQVLRLHSQTFLHFMRCKQLIGNIPKSLTSRKMYGRYWHSLTTHAPVVQRIISLSSVHTEEEERTFSTINSIANGTTSRRHCEIITPTLVRIQAESKHKEKEGYNSSAWSQQNSKVSQFSTALPKFPNSLIPHHFLIKYPAEYQCHLERISDYLHCGEGVWWQRDIRGVEFLDGVDESDSKSQGPFLHHFRYSDLKMEEDYLKHMWRRCLNENITIPHTVITSRNEEDTDDIVIRTAYFEEDEDNESDNGEEEDTYINDDPQQDQEESEDENVIEDEVEIGFQCEDNEFDLTLSDNEDVSPTETYSPTVSLNLQYPSSHLSTHSNEQPQVKEICQATPLHCNVNSDPSTCPIGSQRSSMCNSDKEIITILNKQIQSSNDYNFQTDLAKNLIKVITTEKELVRILDKARIKWKELEVQNINRYTEAQRKNASEHYLQALAQVQTKVLAQHDPLKAQLKNWEENYFMENNQKEPQTEDILNCSEAYSLYKRLRLCKKLLLHWKISLHER